MTDFPEFFKEIPSIVTYDPLAELLGTFKNGKIIYNYIQIVKAAGHSCPSVAGAYMMTYHALKALYPDSLPVRGEIKVEFKEDLQDGVAGVIANVVTNITGATDKSGFKGLGGKFARHSLMFFNAPVNSSIRFTRLDTGKSVDVYYDPSRVSDDPRMQPLMQKAIQGIATEEEKELFGELWQEKVKKILVDHFDDIVKTEIN
jgi:hypothetical protein